MRWWEYIFTLQGLFIFIFHGFCRQIVRIKCLFSVISEIIIKHFSKYWSHNHFIDSFSHEQRQGWKQKLKQERVALPVSGKPFSLQDDAIFNHFSETLSKDDQMLHDFGAKNTAIFFEDQTTDDTRSNFDIVYGSQDTESSYIGSVSSHWCLSFWTAVISIVNKINNRCCAVNLLIVLRVSWSVW